MESNSTSKEAEKKTAHPVSKKTAGTGAAKVSKKATARTSKKDRAGTVETTSAAIAHEKPGKTPLWNSKRPILVPVDFSAHSTVALEHAALVSACTHSPIVVLHVVHDPGDAPGYYQVKGRKKQLRRIEDVAGEMLDAFMDKIAKRHSDQPALKKAKRMLVTGLPVSRILEVAEKLKPSLVVMGSAGRTGLSRVLLGSKAEQLVRICPYTVTIVKLSDSKE